MKLFRKMTALLLSVLIALSVLYVLPANTFITAAAAEVEDESDTAYNSGDFSYEILDSESVKINSYTGRNEEAVIPDMIGTYKVTVLGEVFRANRFVKTVTIGQYVREIDSPSFCSFTAVEQFEVSEQNPYLKSVDGVIFSKDGKTLVRTPAKLSGSYTVPAGVETIGDYAMADSREVESITFGNDVKVIGNSACKYISALKSVSFGSKLEEIGENAFESCYDLASLTFPNSLKTIGKEAFRNCNGPETLVLPDSLKTIGDYAFADLNDLKYIEIGSGLETLGEGAFMYCDALASFSVSASNANFKAVDGVLLSKDGKSLIAVPCAISGSFTVPDGVTEIPDNAFYQCDNLTSIKVADSVTTVGIDAFSCCDKLTKVDLGDGVTSVGAGAFYSDPELKELRFGKAFSEFSADMFITNSGYGGYYEPTNVETIVFSDDNPYYKTVDGVVYSKDGTKIVMIPSGFTGDFTVPDGVTTLESGAFDNCPGVTGLIINHNLSIAENCFVNTYIYKLVFGNNVTEIPVGAFSGMRLFELVIGDGITEIPDYAFQDAFYKHVSFIDDGPSVASSGQKAGETVGASLDWTVNEQEPPISLTIGKNVERIGAHAFENNSFDSITFNNKLNTIGDYAFYGYDGKSYSLETISFPNSLKTIGAYAFENFNDLTEIVLPNGMESVGDYAFANCSSVQTIRLGGTLTVGESAFFSCDETKTLDLGSRLKSVGDSAFFGLLNVTALRLPDSLETIGYSAFADLSALEQLTFGSGLKTIGDNAFQDDSYNEDHLTELRIPDSVLSIGDNAFAYRSALESVVIGSNTETIGNRAFFNCPNIESIDFGKKLKSLGVKAFANEKSWNMPLAPNASLTELVFPDTLETIGEDAFANCIAIESVDLGKSLQGIPSRLFKDLKSLKEITFPDTLKTIGDSAFSGCTALETLKLPASVTDIDNFAFQGCTALSEVDLGNVVSIGWYAFEGCTGITSLKLPDSVNSLGKYALRGMTNLTELKVGKNLTEGLDQSLIEGNVSLKKIIIDEENPVYKSYCGTVLTKDGRTLLLVPKRFTGEYILPETVTSITGSFQGCTGLTSFTFIGRVTTVPENMFSGCNQLHSVILSPETVYINERAFYGCSKLEAIELGDKIRNIGIEAFRGCSKLTEVMIPKSVQSIGDSAFVSCSQLNRVVLSGTYTKLSPNAFYGLSGLNIYCYRNTTTHNSVTELSNASMIKVLYLSDEFYPVDPAITDLTSKSVTFEWKKPKGVSQTVRYNVYRDGVKVASYLTDNSFSQSGLTAGTKYNYEISAIDIAGLESSVRTSITVVPACTTVKAITAPKKDTEIGGTVPVTLTAEMNDTLSSKDAKGEFFYSRDGKDFTSIGEAEMDADMKVFSAKWDLTELVTDTYIIRFVFTDKDGGTSLMDSSVKVDRTPPQKIFGVTTRGRETSISVTWGVAAEADTNKYRIYRKTENETNYSALCDIDGRYNLSYNDSEVENNVVYFYYVVGVDKYGQESAEFDQVPAALIDDIIAPQITKIAPSMNSFIYGDYPVTITAVDNVGVTKIELYCSEDEKNWTLLDSVSGSVFSKPIDTTAMKQGTVYIKATAYDVAGNKSEDSLTYVWSVDNQGPEKIKNVQCINSLSTIVTLSWDQPADDDISYFAVERKDGDGYTEVARSYRALGANLEKLTPDTEYTYRVLAYDRFGNRGAVSDEITVNTEKDTTAPRVTNIAPGANYYNGELELALTVTDDSKVASVKIQVSYDKKNWNTLAAINADTPDQTVVFKHTLNLDDYREGSIFVRGIAKDTAGNEMTDEMASTCEYIVDRTKPSCPEEIKIDSDERMIHVVWSPSTSKDADHYIISRCEEEDGEYEVINKNVKSIDYYDTNVDQFKTYFYKLQTVDYAGNVSRRSDPLSCQVLRDIEDPKLAGFIPEDGETVGMINNKVVACFTDNTMLDNAVVLYSRESSPDDFEILVEKEKIKSGHCTLEKKLPIEDFDDGEKITLFFAAMDTTGNVFESDKAVYTIDKTAPAVENFNITVGEYNFFTLEWEFDEEPHIVDLFRKGDTDNDFVLIREFNNSIEENKDSGVYVDGEVSTSNRSVCYKLVTYDENGNSEEYISEEVPVTSEVPPQAVINSPATVEVGVSNLYSGLLSTDDREIVSYHFDFGDGTQLDDTNCYHTYSETGSYRLVLTVTDSDGLTSSTSKMIHVNERSLQGKVKVKVVDGNRRAIANASVYMDYNDSDKKQVLKTDEKGEVEFSADIDAHSFAAYKEDYLPQLREGYQINNGYNEPITFELEKSPIVKGEFTIKRMTYNEIVSAGINVNDPKNQNVVKVNTTLYYAGVPKYAEFIWDGVKIRGGEITVTHCGVSRKLVPKVFRGGGPMKIGDGDGEDIIPNVAYIDIPVDVTVLKEFFDVKLHIINNANKNGFSLTGNTVTLDLPAGLSVVNEVSRDYIQPGNINDGNYLFTKAQGYIPVINNSATITWIVRGDTPGAYKIGADYTANISKINERIDERFEAKDSICVEGEEKLDITIEAENISKGDLFYFNVKIRNNGSHVKNLVDINIPFASFYDEYIDNEGNHHRMYSQRHMIAPGETFVYHFRSTLRDMQKVREVWGDDCKFKYVGSVVEDINKTGNTVRVFTYDTEYFEEYNKNFTAPPKDFTIYVKHRNRGKIMPLEGAVVSLDGKTVITGKNGAATIRDMSEQLLAQGYGALSIKKDGYYSYDRPMYDKFTVAREDDIVLTSSSNPCVASAVMVRDVNVMDEKKTIDITDDNDYVFMIQTYGTVGTIKFILNDQPINYSSISEVGDGMYCVTFNPHAFTYRKGPDTGELRMWTYAGANVDDEPDFSCPLFFKVVDLTPIKAVDGFALANYFDVEIPVPDGPFEGHTLGINLADPQKGILTKLKIPSVCYADGEVYFGYGIDLSSYVGAVTQRQMIGKLNEAVQNLIGAYNKGKGEDTNTSVSLTPEFGVTGYLRLGFDDNDDPCVLGTHLYIMASLAYGVKKQVFPGGVPVILGLEVKGRAEENLDIDINFNHLKHSPGGLLDKLDAWIKDDCELTLSLIVTASGGLGVVSPTELINDKTPGWLKAILGNDIIKLKGLSVGVYGSGKGDFIINGDDNKWGLDKVKFTLAIGVQFEAILFSGKIPVWDKTWILYDRDKNKEYDTIGAGEDGPVFTIKPFDESLGSQKWLGEEVVSGSDRILLDRSVTTVAPKIVNIGGTTMMVYKGANKNATITANSESIFYSIYDKSKKIWKEPVQADLNLKNDAEFDLKEIGGKLYLVYNQANKVYSEDPQNVEEFAGSYDIYVSEFNPSVGRFMPEVRVTDDSFYDCMPQLTEYNGAPAVVWLKDTSNNPFNVDTSNSLFFSVKNDEGWSEPRVLAENIENLSSFKAGVIGGKACAAYVTSDYEAGENVLKTVTLDGNETTEITRGQVYPNIQFTKIQNRDYLLYGFENDIVKLSDIGSEAEVLYENASYSCLGGYEFVTGSDGNTAIVYTEDGDDESSQAYAIYMDNKTGKFGRPVRINSTGNYTEQIGAGYIDGNLTVAYCDADVTITEDDIIKDCSLRVATAAQGINLSVDKIDVDYSTVSSDGTISASAVVTNTGDTSTSNFDLTVKDDDGNVLGTTHFDGTLESGESGNFEFSFNAPVIISKEKLTLTVEDSAFSKADRMFTLGKCDMELSSRQLFFGDETVIEATVTNNNDFASVSQLQIVDEKGEVVYSQDISYMTKGESVRIEIEDPEQYADAKGRLRLRVESKEDDYNPYNNTEMILLDKVYEQFKARLGDVNGDGAVDVLDANLIQKYAVDKVVLTDEQLIAGDVNDDGVVDVLDSVDILKYVVEKITSFRVSISD